MEKEIIWTQTSQNQLEDVYFYLLEETKSFEIADKVIDALIISVEILKSNWETYEIDEMRIPTDSNYRAFEKFNYRISYKIDLEKIYIIRVRHTSRNPKQFR
ncbi:type II toxin-antitoxin system RelE/ParE family toxin [Flavobacterium sp. SUN052]|uniref:type II toxin-antitoxin system RelE/ParE family toxin n=1 Tax=Flavobacterium sp. SUN052 TaxID=3002441 RepID=UPI00237E7F7A|nr:type II toxin-antitoxin system RelE/ParE family toxin [Flavobacterium sp. SUN052]MEC4005761.1 type II toxin-antitoxin system RelE/ParE family toxin [Flavobacterium sp. SUN052]